MVVMAIPVGALHGARSCCWCGLSQTCQIEEDPVEHGPFRPDVTRQGIHPGVFK
jgi:hypothetical protein